MKLLSILFLMALSTNAYSSWCDQTRDITVEWGSAVDVQCTENVNFIVETDVPVDFLWVNIENYSTFECEATLSQVNPNQVQVSVSWFPGSDLSGCILYLESVDGRHFDRSELYMSY